MSKYRAGGKAKNDNGVVSFIWHLGVGFIFSNSNFFVIKTSHANNWSAKKIPTCVDLALLPVKSKVEISQNFVAFSEYINFNSEFHIHNKATLL